MIARRRMLIAAAAATVLAPPARALIAPRPADTLRFVFPRPGGNPRTQWMIRVYTELLQELGKRFVFVDVPPRRGAAMLAAGEVDGDMGRTYDYLPLYPMLVRVAEPTYAVRFAAYAMRAGLRFDSWAELRASGLRCEYRLGISELETIFARELEPARVTTITSVPRGLQKLRLQRNDLYFDVEEVVNDYLYFLSDTERAAAGLERLYQAGIVQTTTGHAYLHSSHADLAPLLSAGLQRMKRSGVLQRYLAESLAAYKQQLERAAERATSAQPARR
jgi:hypothetical protein